MKKSFKQIFCAMVLLSVLGGCVKPIVVVGKITEPVDAESVKLYYTQRPQCEFETVGYLRINGGYYSKASLFN